MKKTIVLFCLAIVVLTTSIHGVSGCGGDEKKQSPFVGTWDWTENVPGEQSFNIRIGERNDSLLFSISGVFFGDRNPPGITYGDAGRLIVVGFVETSV